MSVRSLQSRVEELAARAGLRDISRQTLMAIVVVCLGVSGYAVVRWGPASDRTVMASGSAEAAIVSDAAVAESVPVEPSGLIVHVAGSVRHPGVYELPSGSRVVDAVTDAGGLLPDACAYAVNLARTLEDGEQVYVPDEDEAAGGSLPVGGGTPGTAAAPPGAAGTQLVDINSADAAALETLPGVGPSTAAKIVADREANGRFGSVDELTRVSGIGPKKLEALKDLACAN